MSVAGDQVDVRTTEVDGVRVVWLPVEGPLIGSLMFRSGRADETLATSGLSHLVEHLALYPIGSGGHATQFNGYVDSLSTVFHASGEPSDVADFLGRVCAGLADLPFDRLDAERRILRSEADQRSQTGPLMSLLRWRYGPVTYGLPAYDELGLYDLDEQRTRDWAATRFGRENAVLWLSGEPPSGLRLPLGDGPRIPPPEPSSALDATPSWYVEGTSGAALLTTVDRTSAATALRHVLEKSLRARLRYDQGASYSPNVMYEPRDASTGHLWVVADAVEGHQRAVRDDLLTALEAVSGGLVDEQALAEWRRETGRGPTEPGHLRGWTHSRAWETLIGGEDRTFESLMAEVAAVGPEDVQRTAEQARANALYLLPEGHRDGLGHMAAAPIWSSLAVTSGQTFLTLTDSPKKPRTRLTVGREGVSVFNSDTEYATVPADRCAAALAWADGRRVLFSEDGFRLDLVPGRWEGGAGLAPSVDSVVPAGSIVRMPAPGPGEEPSVPQFVEPRRQWIGTGLFSALTVGVAAAGVASSTWLVFPLAVLAAWSGLCVRELVAFRRVRGLTGLPRRWRTP